MRRLGSQEKICQGTHSWTLQGPGEVKLVATVYSPPAPAMTIQALCAPDVSDGKYQLIGTMTNPTFAHQ